MFFRKPRLFGVMITRNDMPILGRWMARHAALFDKLAVVDGSDDDTTKKICEGLGNVLHRRDPAPPITDQTLRAAGWALMDGIARRGDWIMLCHPDEFYIHDPRTFLGVRSPVIRWAALHVLPHTSERDAWAHDDSGADVTRLFRHYWWKDNGTATLENRMFRIGSPPEWDMEDPRPSSSVLPSNYQSLKPWRRQPAYLHYKIQQLDPRKFSGTRYVDSNLQTGLGGTRSIESVDDLFFDESRPWGHKDFVHCSDDPTYRQFDQFRGRFRLPVVDAKPGARARGPAGSPAA
jgi:hypothetical protein